MEYCNLTNTPIQRGAKVYRIQLGSEMLHLDYRNCQKTEYDFYQRLVEMYSFFIDSGMSILYEDGPDATEEQKELAYAKFDKRSDAIRSLREDPQMFKKLCETYLKDDRDFTRLEHRFGYLIHSVEYGEAEEYFIGDAEWKKTYGDDSELPEKPKNSSWHETGVIFIREQALKDIDIELDFSTIGTTMDSFLELARFCFTYGVTLMRRNNVRNHFPFDENFFKLRRAQDNAIREYFEETNDEMLYFLREENYSFAQLRELYSDTYVDALVTLEGQGII